MLAPRRRGQLALAAMATYALLAWDLQNTGLAWQADAWVQGQLWNLDSTGAWTAPAGFVSQIGHPVVGIAGLAIIAGMKFADRRRAVALIVAGMAVLLVAVTTRHILGGIYPSGHALSMAVLLAASFLACYLWVRGLLAGALAVVSLALLAGHFHGPADIAGSLLLAAAAFLFAANAPGLD